MHLLQRNFMSVDKMKDKRYATLNACQMNQRRPIVREANLNKIIQ
jgi:hypothetical protein